MSAATVGQLALPLGRLAELTFGRLSGLLTREDKRQLRDVLRRVNRIRLAAAGQLAPAERAELRAAGFRPAPRPRRSSIELADWLFGKVLHWNLLGKEFERTSDRLSRELVERWGMCLGAGGALACLWPRRAGCGDDTVDEAFRLLEGVGAIRVDGREYRHGTHGPYYSTREVWIGDELLHQDEVISTIERLEARAAKRRAGARAAIVPGFPGTNDRSTAKTEYRRRDRGTPGGDRSTTGPPIASGPPREGP